MTDPTWQSAMVAFAPVFGYVTLQDQLATPKALQEYLQALLALGPCFAELRNDVAEKAEQSKSAAQRLQQEKRLAIEAVDFVDQRYRESHGPTLPPLSWPHLFTCDVDGWLVEQGLGDAAAVVTYRPSRELIGKAHEFGLEELARTGLKPLLAAANELAIADACLALLDSALRRVDTSRAASRGAVTAERRAAAREVADILLSSEFAALVGTVEQRCDRREQWTAERRKAVEPLVELWRNTGRLAEEASDWAEALKKLTTLQTSLRTERGRTLTEELDAVLRRLLPEEGISVTGVSFRTTKDDDALRLARQRGAETEPVRLGMLSGGQRNALLLAPLLRLPSGGPFRFLLIDDPVHALDDMRIDLLSGELLRLTEHRRVIVLTHDARLQEVLLARCPDAQLLTLERGHHDG